MSRSRNYQRSRRPGRDYWSEGKMRTERRDRRALPLEVLDGDLEHWDHASRGGRLVYWTPWAVERIELEARTRRHRGRRLSGRRRAWRRADRRIARSRALLARVRNWGETVMTTVYYPKSVAYLDGI